jgi:hypothetical protein
VQWQVLLRSLPACRAPVFNNERFMGGMGVDAVGLALTCCLQWHQLLAAGADAEGRLSPTPSVAASAGCPASPCRCLPALLGKKRVAKVAGEPVGAVWGALWAPTAVQGAVDRQQGRQLLP